MLEIKIIQYDPKHYFQIDRRKYDLESFEATRDPVKTSRAFLKGPSFTVFLDGQILLCAGIIKLWSGVGEAWVITSPLIEKYPILTTRTCKKLFKDTREKYGFIRVQAIARTDFYEGQAWAESMGFAFEGLMKKYYAGLDFYRFAWVKED